MLLSKIDFYNIGWFYKIYGSKNTWTYYSFHNLQLFIYMARKIPCRTSWHVILCCVDIRFTMTTITYTCFCGHPSGCPRRRPSRRAGNATMSSVLKCNVSEYIPTNIDNATVNVHIDIHVDTVVDIADVLDDRAEAHTSQSVTSHTTSHETYRRLPKHGTLWPWKTSGVLLQTSQRMSAWTWIETSQAT